jgi:hypothetical protein
VGKSVSLPTKTFLRRLFSKEINIKKLHMTLLLQYKLDPQNNGTFKKAPQQPSQTATLEVTEVM